MPSMFSQRGFLPSLLYTQVPEVSGEHWLSQLLTERGVSNSPSTHLPSQPCPGGAGAARGPVPSLWPLSLGGCSVQCPGQALSRFTAWEHPGSSPLSCWVFGEGRDAAPGAAGWVQQEVRPAKLGV